MWHTALLDAKYFNLHWLYDRLFAGLSCLSAWSWSLFSQWRSSEKLKSENLLSKDCLWRQFCRDCKLQSNGTSNKMYCIIQESVNLLNYCSVRTTSSSSSLQRYTSWDSNQERKKGSLLFHVSFFCSFCCFLSNSLATIWLISFY